MNKHLFLNIVLITIFFLFSSVRSQNDECRLIGFHNSPYFNEQIQTFNYDPQIKVHINAPSPKFFDPSNKVMIALFALPNGNTTEQTIGELTTETDDWRFDIQHIGAQTRFIRSELENVNFVTVYLENEYLSWPAWKSKHENHHEIISNLVDSIKTIFKNFSTEIVLTGHSGGGRFVFSFIDHYKSIPTFVKRIVFLDSNYGYNDDYGAKFVEWLNSSPDNLLFTIAYNDSVALYNGKHVVSDTGGTWYRSKLMQKYLSKYFEFEIIEDDELINYVALDGRIKIILKKNPNKEILHTTQVEQNGFIHSILYNTRLENINYKYYQGRAYSNFVQNNINSPKKLNIPERPETAQSGSSFMNSVESMPFLEREVRIYEEISKGNIPNFLRNLIKLKIKAIDAKGNLHTLSYDVMPDYLAIGSDEDYCRVPIGPITAQKIADLFGAVLPTSKLVDEIYKNAEVKLEPVTYTPNGNLSELVPKFVMHNNDIEQQLKNAHAKLGQLIAGTKKDVVLSNTIIDPKRPNHVVIYGWHKLDGKPIQPLRNIHINTYTDYSHGIRLINDEVLLDGELKSILEILKDENLYKIISDETCPMIQPSY